MTDVVALLPIAAAWSALATTTTSPSPASHLPTPLRAMRARQIIYRAAPRADLPPTDRPSTSTRRTAQHGGAAHGHGRARHGLMLWRCAMCSLSLLAQQYVRVWSMEALCTYTYSSRLTYTYAVGPRGPCEVRVF
jgi:hypothetical protein